MILKFHAFLPVMLVPMQLRGQRHIIGMLGMCETTVVTEYYSVKLLHHIWRHGHDLPMREVVEMSMDAAKGLQVHT